MARLHQHVELPDKHGLGYDEYGVPDGNPLFYFHGTPSSRVEWKLFGSEQLAQRLNLRIIVPDRPGIGLSDFQSGRSINGWPTDASALADALGIDRFTVLGFSGGCPYAAACALNIPERLTAVGIVSGTGPFNEPGLVDTINPTSRQFDLLARDKPWLSRVMLLMMGLTERYVPDRFITQAMKVLSEPDREVFAKPEVQHVFLQMVREAVRQGPRGAQVDTALMVSPWGFRLQDISMAVHLWHGEMDNDAPIRMGRYMAETIPTCQATFYPGEGHLSTFFNHVEEILGVLVL